ncbi:MAG: hypothetical protein FWH40_09360 [Coriobacteriia bacterium]|nr:hypothetical protein [Coriobacteriia bacterium]
MKKLMVIIIVSLLILNSFIIPNKVYALSNFPFRIYSFNPIVYQLHYSMSSVFSIGLNNAVATWNSHLPSGLLAVSSQVHYSNTFPSKNGVNEVFNLSMNTEYIAMNSMTYCDDGMHVFLYESDINMNSCHSFYNGYILFDYDAESIFLHEIGHSVGILDTYDASESAYVMYGYGFINTLKRSLTLPELLHLPSLAY